MTQTERNRKMKVMPTGVIFIGICKVRPPRCVAATGGPVTATGVIFIGICKVRTPRCVAATGGPVTAVWTAPGRVQVNACKPCLEEQIRQGRWIVEGARVRGMRQQALVDIAVYSQDDELQLIAEIKTRLGVSYDWAKEAYFKVMDAPFLSEAPFFCWQCRIVSISGSGRAHAEVGILRISLTNNPGVFWNRI